MGRIVFIGRLAVRDVRHRPGPAVLLVLAIVAAATTLTLALALRGVSDQPYQQTRAATAGPDVVAEVSPPQATGGRRPARHPGRLRAGLGGEQGRRAGDDAALWWLAATVLGIAAAVAALTAVPAWLGTRRPAGDVLQSELA